MKKIQLKTEGLSGENLAFVQQLNTRFAEIEIPEAVSDDKINGVVTQAIRSTLKGLINDQGGTVVDFAKVTAIDFDKLAEMMGDGDKGIRSVLAKQGDLLRELKEMDNPTSRIRTVRDQLKDFHEKNKEALERFKTGESKMFGIRSVQVGNSTETGAGIELQLHTRAANMTTGQGNSSKYVPEFEVIPGLVDIARTNQPFLEQYANTASTNRSRIAWSEKYNKQGNATFLAEGATKQLISFEWRSFETYAKKVAAKMKVSTEALDDVDWMAAEIEYELKYEVDVKVNQELLSGSGDGTLGATTLKGITQYAGGFVLTSIATTTPNNFDSLRAVHAQIVSTGFNPTHVFINPIDAANMDLLKDANGRPLAMEYRADGRIFRLVPVETNDIPVGSFLMGDMSRFKIRNYKPFAIYYGWVGSDFENNMVTVLGERRLHCFVASNDTGAFVYDQYSDVKSAILAP
jgi:HK97 family phage major capsid protein